MTTPALVAPFPYFGGKRAIAAAVWARLGEPKQYIEPFCGSAAMLLAAPKPASLEVISDSNGLIANFWRTLKNQPDAVAERADYPVSHVDLSARHAWLMTRRAYLAEALADQDWPGDAKIAGWWLWGQCAWIGTGWCNWDGARKPGDQIPAVGNAGMGIHARGPIPQINDTARGFGAKTAAHDWLFRLAERLRRVRVLHGEWSRCLNHHYGGRRTAVFLDPPYRSFEHLYGGAKPVALAPAKWALEHGHLRVALCGHAGDYDLPGWLTLPWTRPRTTMGSRKTRAECVWFSPGCEVTRDFASRFNGR